MKHFYTDKLGLLIELQKQIAIASKTTALLLKNEQTQPSHDVPIYEEMHLKLAALSVTIDSEHEAVAPLADEEESALIGADNMRLAELRCGKFFDRVQIVEAYCERFNIRYNVVDLKSAVFLPEWQEWNTTLCGSFVTDENCTHAVICVDDDGSISVMTPADAAEGNSMSRVTVPQVLKAIASGKKMHVNL